MARAVIGKKSRSGRELENDMGNIGQMIKALAHQGANIEAQLCTVTAVDAAARTVDCEPLDESAPLLGVNLQANQGLTSGMVLIPKVGSYVIVALMNDGVNGCVIATEDVERMELVIGEARVEVTEDGIVLNGGALGGMVKVEELTSKLNELIDAFNNHTHTLMTGTVNVAGSATAQSNAAPITVPAITSKHTKVSRGDYENEKVKQ